VLGALGNLSDRVATVTWPHEPPEGFEACGLQRLAELLDKGELRVHIQRRSQLAEAGEALQAWATSHTRGKLGILIT
jgi:NADPH:quinone reductase-like Zn-dependent oxidoreductase